MPRIRAHRPKKKKPHYRLPPLPPICIKVYGSSHASKKHGLQRSLYKFFQEQDRGHFPPSGLDFYAEPGGRIGPRIVSMVRKALSDSLGKPQCHVLIWGTNNGRDKEKPASIAAHFRQILEFAEGIPKSHVVVCGLLPSPEGAERKGSTTEVFRDISILLKDLTTRYSRCSFLDIPDFFTDNGVVKEHLYSVVRKGRMRGLKDIHFNREGAALYAKALGQHIAFLKRETWL